MDVYPGGSLRFLRLAWALREESELRINGGLLFFELVDFLRDCTRDASRGFCINIHRFSSLHAVNGELG